MVEDAPVNTGAVQWPDVDSAFWAVRRMQLKLHRWASGHHTRRFGDLFNLVYDPAFLVHAWERVSSNVGARTAGVDRVRVAQILARGGVDAGAGRGRAHAGAHRVALRAGVSVLVPLVVLAVLGHQEWSIYAAFGAVTALYGRTHVAISRLRMQRAPCCSPWPPPGAWWSASRSTGPGWRCRWPPPSPRAARCSPTCRTGTRAARCS